MTQLEKVEVFRRLHESGCFVLPNPWDRGTAVCLESLGFSALATTSAGLGFSLGIPDSVGTISRDLTLCNIRDIVGATSLPVNADFQEGFAKSCDELFENIKLCIAAGVAGLSIEDATGDVAEPLFERSIAIERMKAARAAIDETGIPVLLTGRCEAWLVGDKNPFETVLDRLVAYADAGADCLFAPGVKDSGQIQKIVAAVHPKPVNVIISSNAPGLNVQVLG